MTYSRHWALPAHIFLIGVVLKTLGTQERGRMVCWLGLFIPAASFASIWWRIVYRK